ncbi:MAG: hypothetical protein ACTS5A_04065 [Candidatus Hodgkinia cicadicola]
MLSSFEGELGSGRPQVGRRSFQNGGRGLAMRIVLNLDAFGPRICWNDCATVKIVPPLVMVERRTLSVPSTCGSKERLNGGR